MHLFIAVLRLRLTVTEITGTNQLKETIVQQPRTGNPKGSGSYIAHILGANIKQPRTMIADLLEKNQNKCFKTIDFMSDINYNDSVVNVGQKVGEHVGKNGKTKF